MFGLPTPLAEQLQKESEQRMQGIGPVVTDAEGVLAHLIYMPLLDSRFINRERMEEDRLRMCEIVRREKNGLPNLDADRHFVPYPLGGQWYRRSDGLYERMNPSGMLTSGMTTVIHWHEEESADASAKRQRFLSESDDDDDDNDDNDEEETNARIRLMNEYNARESEKDKEEEEEEEPPALIPCTEIV